MSIDETSRRPRMLRALGVGLAAALAAGALTGTAEARKATPAERTAIVAAWEAAVDLDESAVCKRTWIIRVAQSTPRLASLTGNNVLRERFGCQVGDGYAILRRPTPRCTRWRVLFQASGEPPSCRLVSPRVSRQLGFGGDCFRTRPTA